MGGRIVRGALSAHFMKVVSQKILSASLAAESYCVEATISIGWTSSR